MRPPRETAPADDVQIQVTVAVGIEEECPHILEAVIRRGDHPLLELTGSDLKQNGFRHAAVTADVEVVEAVPIHVTDRDPRIPLG